MNTIDDTNKTANNKSSRFGRGGVFECISCGKKTRQTGHGNEDLELCIKCYDEAGEENERADHEE